MSNDVEYILLQYTLKYLGDIFFGLNDYFFRLIPMSRLRPWNSGGQVKTCWNWRMFLVIFQVQLCRITSKYEYGRTFTINEIIGFIRKWNIWAGSRKHTEFKWQFTLPLRWTRSVGNYTTVLHSIPRLACLHFNVN